MQKKIGALIVLGALLLSGIAGAQYFQVGYFIKSPKDKFQLTWNQDLELLKRSGSLPKQWESIREIVIRTDDSPIQDWLNPKSLPIPKNPQGTYQLDILFTHWIENNRYGVVIQYDLFDSKSKNLVWSLGRTHTLGFVY